MKLFHFIFRERFYWFLLILSLGLITFSRPLDVPASAESEISSAAFQTLQRQAEDWNLSLNDWSAWLAILEKNPGVVLMWVCVTACFFLLFTGGLGLGLGELAYLPLYRYFHRAVAAKDDVYFPFVLLFRMGVLIFAVIAGLGWMTGVWVQVIGYDEPALGIFQTLILGFFACWIILIVIKKEGISGKQFWGQAPQGVAAEILRGAAEYLRVFPWFALALFAVLWISALFQYEPPPHPLVEVFLEKEKGAPVVFYTALMLAAVAAPLMEEIFFRGFLYRIFRRPWGMMNASLLSAALFAALHGSWFTFLPILVLGVALARLYEKRGTLIACWTFHMLHNILFTAYFFAAKNMLGALYG